MLLVLSIISDPPLPSILNSVLGSRFKRVALPLGLMSAGASLCYPAQAVAVVKVTLFLNADLLTILHTNLFIFRVKLSLSFSHKLTGKKLYAAGHWGTAAVSSLFTAKPQEPVTNKPGSPQPQVHSHIECTENFPYDQRVGKQLTKLTESNVEPF